jgi:hypothetical protein
MKKPANHLPPDFKALCYLDALNAGDLETVAALWEEASHDPLLERVFAELDGALFAEIMAKPGARAEAVPRRYRRSTIWVGVLGALAAACLLVVLGWPRGDVPNPKRNTQIASDHHGDRTPKTKIVSPSLAEESARPTAWLETRRILEGAEPPAFNWPLQESSPLRASKSVPGDLLN